MTIISSAKAVPKRLVDFYGGIGAISAAQTRNNKTSLAVAAMRVANFIYTKSIKGIVISGRSSRLIALPLLAAAWERHFPHDPSPSIFDFGEEGNRLLYKNLEDQGQRHPLVRAYIRDHLPMLRGMKSENLCYVDDFIITGEKYLALRSIFDDQGYKNVSFAFFTGYIGYYFFHSQDFIGVEDLALEQFLWANRGGSPALQRLIEKAKLLIQDGHLNI